MIFLSKIIFFDVLTRFVATILFKLRVSLLIGNKLRRIFSDKTAISFFIRYIAKTLYIGNKEQGKRRY